MNQETQLNPGAKTLTLVIDVQNDFLPGGSLAVAEGDQVIQPLNQVIDATRAVGGIVIFSGDQHPAKTPHFDKWPPHCVVGSPGAQLAAKLDVRETDLIVAKGQRQTDGYSALEGILESGDQTKVGQGLTEYLQQTKPNRIYIGGLATDYCVLNTVLDTLKIVSPATTVYLLKDAVKGVELQFGDVAKALETMQDAGAKLVTVASAITELKKMGGERDGE